MQIMIAVAARHNLINFMQYLHETKSFRLPSNCTTRYRTMTRYMVLSRNQGTLI